MPWCDDCSKFWNADRMGPEGTCPSCGNTLAATRRSVPWHFKLMLIAFAGYMVYRIYWLAEWLPKHL